MTFTSKILVGNSFEPKTTTLESVLEFISEEMKHLPISIKKLDARFQEDRELLNRYFSINVTSKKENKARDYFCDGKLNLKGGFQQYLGIMNNAYNDTVRLLEAAKELPEVLYFAHCEEDESLHMLTNPDADIEIHRREFSNIETVMILSEEESEDFTPVTIDQLDTIGCAYLLNELAVDVGEVSCGSSSGFGEMHDDVNYIKQAHGIRNENHRVSYHAVNSNDRAVMVMSAFRASNDEIDSIIDQIKVMQKETPVFTPALISYNLVWHLEGDSSRANIVLAKSVDEAVEKLISSLNEEYETDIESSFHLDHSIELNCAISAALR